MQDLIPKELFPIISDYIKVLVPSLITYFVTRYSLNKPRKYEIRQKQFDKVYLPLYLATRQWLNSDNYAENLKIYSRKFYKIINSNYPLVYPKTIKLFEKLKSSYDSGKINSYYLANFESQINSDYEKLKRELGYPTNSFIDFFKRLSLFNKLIYLLFLSFSSFTIYATVSAFLLFLSGDILNSFSALCVAVIMWFLMYLFYRAIHY